MQNAYEQKHNVTYEVTTLDGKHVYAADAVEDLYSYLQEQDMLHQALRFKMLSNNKQEATVLFEATKLVDLLQDVKAKLEGM